MRSTYHNFFTIDYTTPLTLKLQLLTRFSGTSWQNIKLRQITVWCHTNQRVLRMALSSLRSLKYHHSQMPIQQLPSSDRFTVWKMRSIFIIVAMINLLMLLHRLEVWYPSCSFSLYGSITMHSISSKWSFSRGCTQTKKQNNIACFTLSQLWSTMHFSPWVLNPTVGKAPEFFSKCTK